MDPVTLQLILALLPVAENLIFKVGGQMLQLDTTKLTREDVLKALQQSRSENWPDLQFVSKKP